MKHFPALLTLVFLLLACAPVIKMQIPTPKPPPNSLLTPTNAALGKSPNALGTAKVTAQQSLNVRNKPLGTVLGYLYHGDVIQLSGRCQDGWAQIAWRGSVAWVRAKYLSDNKCKEEK